MSTLLQQFDLVTVRILNEEKPGEQNTVTFEFFYRCRRNLQARKRGVQRVQIVGHEREMAVRISHVIGCNAFIPGKFDFGTAIDIAKVHEGKIFEFQSVGFFQPQRALVEVQRTLQIGNSDHRVNEFKHVIPVALLIVA